MTGPDFAEVAVANGAEAGFRSPVRRFPSRGENFAPTESWRMAPLIALTHLPSGMRIADGLDLPEAVALAPIYDRILPGEKPEDVLASFVDLPIEIRKWIVGWKHSWKAVKK